MRRAPVNIVDGCRTSAERRFPLVVVAMVVCFIGVPTAATAFLGSAWIATGLLLGIGGSLVCLWLARVWRDRGYAEVRAAQSRLCLDCRYRLLPANGLWHCPECGRTWEYATLEKSWRWTYRED